MGICITGIEIHAQRMKITGDSFWGSTDREYFDKLVRYAMQMDKDPFDKALRARLFVGLITRFHRGEEVFLADDAISFSGPVEVQKVRRKGEVAEYWTLLGASK